MRRTPARTARVRCPRHGSAETNENPALRTTCRNRCRFAVGVQAVAVELPAGSNGEIMAVVSTRPRDLVERALLMHRRQFLQSSCLAAASLNRAWNSEAMPADQVPLLNDAPQLFVDLDH